MSNWRGKRGGEYWEKFAESYPEIYRQVERITDRAGTWDADMKVIHAAAALLADYHDWMMRAKLAMFSRKAISFDGLCRESEEITQDMVREREPLECLECGIGGPLHPTDADHQGWLCPACYAKAQTEHVDGKWMNADQRAAMEGR